MPTGEESERREMLVKISAKTFWDKCVPKEEIFEDVMRVFPASSHALGLMTAKYKVVEMIPVAVAQAKAEALTGRAAAVGGWNEMSPSERLSYFMRPEHCRYLQGEINPAKRKQEAMKAAFRSCGAGAAGRKRYQVVQAQLGESDTYSSESSDDDSSLD